MTWVCKYVEMFFPYDYFYIELREDYSAAIDYCHPGEEPAHFELGYYFTENETIDYFSQDYIHFVGEPIPGPIDLVHDYCYYARGAKVLKTQSVGIVQPLEGEEDSMGYITSTFTRTELNGQ